MSAAEVELRPPVSQASRATPTGLILIGLWIIAGAALLFGLVTSIDAGKINEYGGRFLSGFLVTIELVAMSVALGALISLPVAAGRLSRNWLPAGLAYCYSYFFRGTPLIAQTFLIYYGVGEFAGELRALGLWWFFRDAYYCAFLAFGLNTAAYQAEILAGSIRNVPTGQREAAAALGLHWMATMRKVVLPQALILALRPYGNEIILMVKASAIASIITVLDLMGETRYIFSRSYDLTYYLWAAVFYLIIVETLRRTWNLLEKRMARHLMLRRG